MNMHYTVEDPDGGLRAVIVGDDGEAVGDLVADIERLRALLAAIRRGVYENPHTGVVGSNLDEDALTIALDLAGLLGVD